MNRLGRLVLVFIVLVLASGAVKPKTRKGYAPQISTAINIMLRSHKLASPERVSTPVLDLGRPGNYTIVVTFPRVEILKPVANMVVIYERDRKAAGKDCVQHECWAIVAHFRRTEGGINIEQQARPLKALSQHLLVASWAGRANRRKPEPLTGSDALDGWRLTFESSLQVQIRPAK